LMPLDSLRHEGVFALDPDATYIVCCDTGRRSRAAAFLLQERGIRALSLVGGIIHWPYEVEGATV
jgi:rhodanese-related sulfurtransferase